MDTPWAFDDHPAVRHAYISAFVSAAFDSATHNGIKTMLKCSRTLLRSATSMYYPGLENFALTLPTVERRLGLSTDSIITYVFLCDACWMPHLPEELSQLESPHCNRPACKGTLYTTSGKKSRNGTEKRTPTLTMPFAPPEKVIERMCLRPGKVQQWQHWRRPDDTVGICAPSTLQGMEAFDDPDKPMQDITDGWGWRAIQGGLERRRNGKWEVKDVDVKNLNQRFVAFPNGLVAQINVDWFQAVDGACHSTGAMYMTICNNPRGIRYLLEETALIAVFPGPHEPTIDQYRNVMELIVARFKRLYNGQIFRVFGQDEPEIVHVQIGTDISDLPASRRTSGLLSFTSTWFMCDRCTLPFFSLTDPDTFNSSKICACKRDPSRYLKYSFRARDASAEVAEEISLRRGIRYAPVHNLPNWFPGETNLVDPMHAIFLCLVKHICRNIIHANGLVSPAGNKKMDEFFKKVVWPPSMSRLPPSMAHTGGSVKADQWRSLISIYFVAVFDVLQVNGEIPDEDAPPIPIKNKKMLAAQHRQEKLVRDRLRQSMLFKNPDVSVEELENVDSVTMDRSLKRHYDTLLQFTAAVRILISNSISPNEVVRGCDMLENSIQSYARMHAHLTPYFHLVVDHLRDSFLRHGPAPNWWTFPYERNNGYLGRFNHNGHSGGELEGTMMRGFWKTVLIQDLITRLEAIQNPAPEDLESLELLKNHIKGGTSERKGTLENYIARVESEKLRGSVQFPRSTEKVYLRAMGLYPMVLEHLKERWRNVVELVPDVQIPGPNQLSLSDCVVSYSHVWFEKRRYGASTHPRGQSARYGYMDSRIPVQIQHIFRVACETETGQKLEANIALARRFRRSNILDFPWDLFATDMGVGEWEADVLETTEAIALEQLSGHFILASLTVQDNDLWITVAHDHDGTEADVAGFDD
ncbi:hypothetical protein C8F01DRAFT_1222141 [Mycena amicta]|nr:hypothetical protein C8F01DRAFT_1222141 [Mycena amicta]